MIILEDDYKLNNIDYYDEIVSAEIPDPDLHPQLYATVIRTMTHGPCGSLNPDAPCMIDDGGHKQCSKNFPKNFQEYNEENEDGYLIY